MAEALAALASMGPKIGITFIKYDDTWDLTEMDLSGVVTKIADAVKKEGADALYIGMNENQGPYICKGLRDLGITVPIYTTAERRLAEALFSRPCTRGRSGLHGKGYDGSVRDSR